MGNGSSIRICLKIRRILILRPTSTKTNTAEPTQDSMFPTDLPPKSSGNIKANPTDQQQEKPSTIHTRLEQLNRFK